MAGFLSHANVHDKHVGPCTAGEGVSDRLCRGICPNRPGIFHRNRSENPVGKGRSAAREDERIDVIDQVAAADLEGIGACGNCDGSLIECAADGQFVAGGRREGAAAKIDNVLAAAPAPSVTLPPLMFSVPAEIAAALAFKAPLGLTVSGPVTAREPPAWSVREWQRRRYPRSSKRPSLSAPPGRSPPPRAVGAMVAIVVAEAEHFVIHQSVEYNFWSTVS